MGRSDRDWKEERSTKKQSRKDSPLAPQGLIGCLPAPKEASVSPVSPSDRTVENFSLGQLQRGLVTQARWFNYKKIDLPVAVSSESPRDIYKRLRGTPSLKVLFVNQRTSLQREAEASPPKEVHSSTLKTYS